MDKVAEQYERNGGLLKPNESRTHEELLSIGLTLHVLASSDTLDILQHIIANPGISPLNVALYLEMEPDIVRKRIRMLEGASIVTCTDVGSFRDATDIVVSLNPDMPDFASAVLSFIWRPEGHEWKLVKKSVSSLYHIVQMYESA